MRRLSQIIGLVLVTLNLTGQSPHGPGLKMDCADCHSPEGWAIAMSQWKPKKMHQVAGQDTLQRITSPRPTFDHNKTAFPLDGQHAQIDCRSCHQTLVFADATPTCTSCHADVHQQSVGQDCARCHTTNFWHVDRIGDLHQDAGFPLTGVHAAVSCTQCHTADNPLRIERNRFDCVSCHAPAFQKALEPNHVKLNLSTDCMACHSIHGSGWAPASFTFEHNKFFVLDGAHAVISNECSACHTGGQYTNTPNTCIGCHTDDYNRTTNPSHTLSKFDKDCTACHTTGAWVPAAFDHAKFYPLKGAHKVIEKDCAACHIGGQYANTPNTCAGCHITDFNQAKSPNHITARFPTSCDDCHSESAWEPATFNHDTQYFPIYSGNHKGEWSQCIECHTTPGNFSTFSCIDCHEHNDAAALAREHRGKRNYEYVSTACYSCHPKGD